MHDLNTSPMRALVLAVGMALALGACSSTPPAADKPVLELPSGTAQSEDIGQWWLRYKDPALTALIERALTNNSDLKIAAARVEESAALLRVARSAYAPSLDANVGANRSQATEKGVIPRPAGTFISNDFSTGLSISYELDLWGRVRDNNRAALAQLAASREAVAGLRSAVAAQVARSYFSLLATDRKIAFVQQTLGTREEALKLAQKRLEGGTANSLQYQQARSERDAAAAVLPRLVAAQAQSERALALLAGDSPRAIIEGKLERSTAEVLPDAPAVPSGLPSDLLARRPDVREAEANLAGSQARVAEARTRYFPQIVLTGNYGYESARLSDLFSPEALVWRIGAALTQPIFGINRINAQVDAAKAQTSQAEANYVKTVQTAFKEVYDAIGNMRAAGDTLTAQTQRSQSLQESLRIAQKRYDAGVASYLETLDAQRNLFSVESDRIDAQADRLNASVDLFRALGGGW